MDILQKNYPYVVMDNEAGLEHISRGTTKNVSYLLIVSDASPRGVRTAARIRDLVHEIKAEVGDMGLVLNRLHNEAMTEAALAEAKKRELPVVGVIPADDTIVEFDLADRSLLELPDDSRAVKAADKILDRITDKMALAK